MMAMKTVPIQSTTTTAHDGHIPATSTTTLPKIVRQQLKAFTMDPVGSKPHVTFIRGTCTEHIQST